MLCACKRCGHKWNSRLEIGRGIPKKCVSCQSRNWATGKPTKAGEVESVTARMARLLAALEVP